MPKAGKTTIANLALASLLFITYLGLTPNKNCKYPENSSGDLRWEGGVGDSCNHLIN